MTDKINVVGVVGLKPDGRVLLNSDMSDQEIKILLTMIIERLDQNAGARCLHT